MKLRTVLQFLILLCFCASLSMATPVFVAAGASFTLSGSWIFDYTSGAADLMLESITLDLSPTDLRFDTAAGGFGSGPYQDLGVFGGTDATTGLSGISATGAALDGGTLVTFSFNNFSQGSFFQFTADVDHPNPTLLSLLDCSKKTGFSLIACNAANAPNIATNTARLVAAQLVVPNQMAGAVVTFRYEGPYDGSKSIAGTFQTVTLDDIVSGITRGDGLGSFDTSAGTNADVTVPEPATMATLVAGSGVLLALARRRRPI